MVKIEQKELHVVQSTVAYDHCIGCGNCVKSCPYNAVRLPDGKAEVIVAQCKGCGA